MSDGEKYSYSKLACFEQCPYKYKLIYLDNHYVKNDTIATSFGTLIHHIAEEIGKSIKDKKPIDYPKLLDEFDTEIKEIEIKYAKDFYSLDKHPVRIELWGDEIVDIRYFNNETQKSIEKLKHHIVELSTKDEDQNVDKTNDCNNLTNNRVVQHNTMSGKNCPQAIREAKFFRRPRLWKRSAA